MENKVPISENLRQTTDLVVAILRRIREKKLDKTPAAQPDNGKAVLAYEK